MSGDRVVVVSQARERRRPGARLFFPISSQAELLVHVPGTILHGALSSDSARPAAPRAHPQAREREWTQAWRLEGVRPERHECCVVAK
jgi:hypothetical protein